MPQWNCNCNNCKAARRGEPWIVPRTQSSIAASPDGRRWVLINASPDIRSQLAGNPAFRPEGERRGTRIAGVIVTDAQIDHTSGLLILREGDRFSLHATASVHDDLTSGFPVLTMLERYCGVAWHEIPADGGMFRVEGISGIRFTAVPLHGKAPPYSSRREDPRPDNNIGLIITDEESGRTAFYGPALDTVDGSLEARMANSDCILVDGTFWTDDELTRTGTGHKTAADMGHLPLSGDAGMLSVLERLEHPAKYLIHINNTNPILDERSPERKALSTAGITVTHDGMVIEV